MSRSAILSKRPATDAAEAAWIADEDRFVLEQAKKKAAIRVKGGRAQPIDWLATTLAVIDPERNPLDDGVDVEELDLREPESVFESLGEKELGELEKGVDGYVVLEHSKSNLGYWNTMKTICADRRKQLRVTSEASARGLGSVAGDLDKLLGPKSLVELEKLEKQITAKLDSNEPIDTDYWEHLLRSLLTYKARAKLRQVTERIVESRLKGLHKEQVEEGAGDEVKSDNRRSGRPEDAEETGDTAKRQAVDRSLSDAEVTQSVSMGTGDWTKRLAEEREKVRKQGYIPGRKRMLGTSTDLEPSSKRQRTDIDTASPAPGIGQSAAQSAFDRDLARGLQENEELLTTEESVTTKNLAAWKDQHRPRKPRYFARVITGYEWNKYNQTHYDHDNPPPKVVQGYKFNILYPDLVDKIRAPTYKIEREGGRRRGEMTAPAGEDDTCVIRFLAGAPYEDVAFRIVDKEWDYSAKRERGFKSSFDKGVLQLHFQFKKIYYRK